MHWSVSPLAGKTTDWRAVCGKFASPVRREGASKPIDASYPYQAFYPDHSAVEALVSRQGINGFYTSVEGRHACCAVRKVEPLRRALAGATAWITGLRADQSDDRAGISFAAFDQQHRLIKVNPLFDWTRDQVLAFIREHGIPYNPLHDQGFLSIGCAPCTRAVAPGEPERAGRWWWEHERKECGLHSRASETSSEEAAS